MIDAPKTLLHSAWLYSRYLTPGQHIGGDRSVVPDAAAVFQNGRILEVGYAKQLQQNHPDAKIIDAGNSIILPGLINPHTHLELSNCCCDPPSASFTDWILSLQSRNGPARDYDAATQSAISQCLSFGVTAVGDISQRPHITRPILADSPLKAVSYGEVLGFARLQSRHVNLLPRAIDRSHESDKFRTGLSPHAPYTVTLTQYRQCLELARANQFPLATHLSELPYEQEFLEHHTGPFRQLYETLGEWSDENSETFPGSPIRFAHAIGLLDYPTLLAHVNYCTDDELDLLAAGRASVVYCPRTHRYFDHPPHRFRDMLARGINLAIGTDSCASSPNLNLLDDLRLVHQLAPEIPPEILFDLVTINAARALQLDNEIGLLAPGKNADFALFSVTSNNPLTELLETEGGLAQVWISGSPVSPTRTPPT